MKKTQVKTTPNGRPLPHDKPPAAVGGSAYGWWLSQPYGGAGTIYTGKTQSVTVGRALCAHTRLGRAPLSRIVLCGPGVHAAYKPRTTLLYRYLSHAETQVLCRVRLDNVRDWDHSKMVAEKRTTLAKLPVMQLARGSRLKSEPNIRAAFEAAGYDFDAERVL